MIVTFNKQQLSELFNRDHFESLLNRIFQEFPHSKIPKMCDPILVTLLKMRPHSSQSSRENVTPSSGTSPLASYKEVTPPPPTPGTKHHRTFCDSNTVTKKSLLTLHCGHFWRSDRCYYKGHSFTFVAWSLRFDPHSHQLK